MKQLKHKTLLYGSGLIFISYIAVLFIWLFLKDHYHLWLISQVVEPLILYNDLEIIQTHWISDNYSAELLYHQFIEIIPKVCAVDLKMPLKLTLGDIPSFSTFATPISLTLVLSYALYYPTKSSLRIIFEVVILLLITHIIIFFIMALLKIDKLYVGMIAHYTNDGIIDVISRPLSSWLFNLLYHVEGFLIKVVVRFEPLLIAFYIFMMHRNKF